MQAFLAGVCQVVCGYTVCVCVYASTHLFTLSFLSCSHFLHLVSGHADVVKSMMPQTEVIPTVFWYVFYVRQANF